MNDLWQAAEFNPLSLHLFRWLFFICSVNEIILKLFFCVAACLQSRGLSSSVAESSVITSNTDCGFFCFSLKTRVVLLEGKKHISLSHRGLQGIRF